MHNSETEEGSEEEEDEEEEDICEEEEEEEEEESEEEDVNGGGGGSSDRVDLGVQTSLLDSPSPTVPSPSTHTQVWFYTYSSSPAHFYLSGSAAKATEAPPLVVPRILQLPLTPCLRTCGTEWTRTALWARPWQPCPRPPPPTRARPLTVLLPWQHRLCSEYLT